MTQIDQQLAAVDQELGQADSSAASTEANPTR
jgi:hypothetical protein